MFQDQEYTIGFDVDDPIQFSVDAYGSAMKYLKYHYEGICFKGAFITNIEKILQLSACQIIDTNTSASGHFDVNFVAKVLKYGYWDIIIGVTVLKTDTLFNITEKHGDRGYASIVANVGNQSILRVDQLVPIRLVLPAIHQPMSRFVTASAVILSCDKKFPVFTIKGRRQITSKLLEDLSQMILLIKNEITLRETIDKKRLFFFEDLLYSYANALIDSEDTINVDESHKWIGFKTKREMPEVVNILSLKEGDMIPVHCSRDLSLIRSSPLINIVKDMTMDVAQIEINLSDFMQHILQNIYNFLIATREMVETYNSDKIIKAHENIWSFMRQNQS
jgi:hypothetical protein